MQRYSTVDEYCVSDERCICTDCLPGSWGPECANTCNCDVDVCNATLGCTGCDEGFSGADCDDVNECAADAAICGAGGTCNNTLGGYFCVCDDGYENAADGKCEREKK